MSATRSHHVSRSPHKPSHCNRSRPTLCGISTTGAGLPLRIVFHGADGAGKTSLAAQFPAPLFLYPSGDTGLETLLDSGRLPPVAHFTAVHEWEEVGGHLSQLAEVDHGYQTLVVDGVGGLERLCHERVCARDFDGDWGELGFHGYQRGFDVAVAEWRKMLAAFELLRAERQMTIVLCAASRLVPYRNPAGADYDRYQPDLHVKTWAVTQRWADVVGFLNFVPGARPPRARPVRGENRLVRVVSTERTIAHDAKNRPGLPSQIVLSGESPAAAYAAWSHAVSALGWPCDGAGKGRRRSRARAAG